MCECVVCCVCVCVTIPSKHIQQLPHLLVEPLSEEVSLCKPVQLKQLVCVHVGDLV